MLNSLMSQVDKSAFISCSFLGLDFSKLKGNSSKVKIIVALSIMSLYEVGYNANIAFYESITTKLSSHMT